MTRRDETTEIYRKRKAERNQRVREKKCARAPTPEIEREQILADLRSLDEVTRARAARQLCPCHADWEVFEQTLDALHRMTKDPSPLVRANALHVFEDAFELESQGLPTTPQALTNEMVARRNQMRWRRDEVDDGGEGDDPRRKEPHRRR